MKKNKILLAAAVSIFIAAIATLLISGQSKTPISQTEFMLDTICTITLYDWRGNEDDILSEAYEVCHQCEMRLSTTVSSSDIYKINHSHGKTVTVSQETAGLLTDALEYCRVSDGAFDITIYPAKRLWDFSGRSQKIPDQKKLAAAIQLVDYTMIHIDGRQVTLPDGMGIDLGAIAKGYAADQVAAYLTDHGVRSAVIDLGGNIYVIGSRPDGSDWRVGIREPFQNNQLDVVEVSDCSVVTSGIYQRYLEADGKLYHHILNADNGMPCETGLNSVTIIGSSSEQCDALSTVCILLGYDQSTQLLRAFPDVRAVFITTDNQLLYYP